MKRTMWSKLVCTIAMSLLGTWTMAADTIKIAHIDPLSGPFALVGDSLSRLLQAAIDEVNAKGGVLNGTARAGELRQQRQPAGKCADAEADDRFGDPLRFPWVRVAHRTCHDRIH